MESKSKYTGVLNSIVVSRRQLIRNTGLTLATVAVTSSVPLSSYIAQAAQPAQALTDLDIVQFALSLEHLEAEFYTQVVAGGNLSGDALTILTAIRDHEIAHVTALSNVVTSLGGTPVAPANYNFGDIGSQAAILQTAEALEDTGVGAYTGAAALITDKTAILPAAASIEQVESRHYAAIRYLRGMDGAPGPLGSVYTVQEVMQKVDPFIVD